MRNQTRVVDLGRERVGEGGGGVRVEITHGVLSLRHLTKRCGVGRVFEYARLT